MSDHWEDLKKLFLDDERETAMSEQLWICDHAETCKNKDIVWCSKPFDGSFRGGFVYSDTLCSLHCAPVKVKPIPYHPKETPMPEYELIKPVLIKALEEAGFPERELHRFAFLYLKRFWNLPYLEALNTVAVIEIASQCEGMTAFLKDKGFIREREPELKPCPFCGSHDVHVEDVQTAKDLMCVKCQTCWAKSAFLGTRAKVIAKWNTRV